MKRILALLLSAFLTAACAPALTVAAAALPPGNAALPPDNLKVNLLREGYNVAYAEDIALTWIFQDSDFDEVQTAYLVELGTDPETFDTYSSGWVSAAAASHIVPGGTLGPNALYCWRVKTRDRAGAESAWSQPATFVTDVGSQWASTNGVWLTQDVSNPALSWTDYTVEQDITITAVALGVYFRAADDTHAYM
ncbi:MAG: hypothetical protein LBF64_06795, partial [Oscillospiraceae bacterium]|nr:hypothetical protein [Oscillospiraceae bacterium]